MNKKGGGKVVGYQTDVPRRREVQAEGILGTDGKHPAQDNGLGYLEGSGNPVRQEYQGLINQEIVTGTDGRNDNK